MDALCGSTDYTAGHLHLLRKMANADRDVVPLCRLQDYLKRAVSFYAGDGEYTYSVIKEILILARLIDPRVLCMDNLLDLVYYLPRLGVKVLLVISRLDCDVLVAYRRDIIGIFRCHRGGGDVRALIRAMSECAPAPMANAFTYYGKWCSLAAYACEACMWRMVDFIKENIDVDSTAAEMMMADDLHRAVRCGLFVDACLLSDAAWPAFHVDVAVQDANTLLYRMATSGCVGAENVHTFARVDTMLPLHIKALLHHPCCPASLLADVVRTRKWLRRRIWMLALTRLRTRQVGGRRLHCASDLLCRVVAIDPICAMITSFV